MEPGVPASREGDEKELFLPPSKVFFLPPEILQEGAQVWTEVNVAQSSAELPGSWGQTGSDCT